MASRVVLLLALAASPRGVSASWYSRAHGRSVWAGILYPESAPAANDSAVAARNASLLEVVVPAANASAVAARTASLLEVVVPAANASAAAVPNASFLVMESWSTEPLANETQLVQLPSSNQSRPSLPAPSRQPPELCSWLAACGRARESVGRWVVPLVLGGFLLAVAVVAGELHRRRAPGARLPHTAKDTPAAAVSCRPPKER